MKTRLHGQGQEVATFFASLGEVIVRADAFMRLPRPLGAGLLDRRGVAPVGPPQHKPQS